MKKLYILLFTILISSLSFGQDLTITGIFDGPLTGGVPKVVELYVINDITDLSSFGLGSANNGGGTDGIEFVFPTDAVTAGTYIYVSTTTTDFLNYFGFNPTYVEANASNINGDDAVELFGSVVSDGLGGFTGTVIDVFGNIAVDGTGLSWDHLDGWAYRKSGTGPEGSTFTDTNWIYSGINATDGCTTNGTCGSVYPIGTYSNVLNTKLNQIQGFGMYPNPTSLGYVTLSSKNNAKMNVAVYDMLGKQVLHKTVTNNKLDVTSLNSGVYIMKVSQDNASVTKKLVIQ